MSKLFKPLGKISGSNLSDIENSIEVIHAELPTGDEDEIMEDDSEESDGEYLEYEKIEKPRPKDETEESFVSDSSSEEEDEGPKVAPRAFIRRNSIKHLSTQLQFRISEYLTIKDITKSFLRVSKAFSRIKLIKYVSTKKFLPIEYEEMLHPTKGVGRLLFKKLLLFKHLDLNLALPWPSQVIPPPVPPGLIKKDDENNSKILSFFTYSCYKGYKNSASYMLKNLSADPTIGQESSLFFAISCGELDIVKQLLLSSQWRDGLVGEALAWAIQVGEVKCLRVLGMDGRAGLEKDYGEGVQEQKKYLLLAIQNGRFDVFKRVLDMVLKRSEFLLKEDDRFRGNAMIEMVNVCSLKEKDGLKMIEYCTKNHLIRDWGANDNICFRMAVSFNRRDVVKFLLKGKEEVDPSANHNEALLFAAEHGLGGIVSLLVKDQRVDVFQSNDAAIKVARKKGHDKVAKVIEKEMKKRRAKELKAQQQLLQQQQQNEN